MERSLARGRAGLFSLPFRYRFVIKIGAQLLKSVLVFSQENSPKGNNKMNTVTTSPKEIQESAVAGIVSGFKSMTVHELANVYFLTLDQTFPTNFRASLYTFFTSYVGNAGIAPEVNRVIIALAAQRGIRL